MFTFEFSDKNPRTPVAFAAFGSMHTVMEMVLVTGDRDAAEKAARAVYDRISELARKFNRFDEKSAVSLINRAETETQIPDEDIYMALQLCEAFRRNTSGYFDICAAHGIGKSVTSPRYTLYAVRRSVKLSSPGTRLDFGGFAKGYALEQAKRIIGEAGIGNALVNFGDSSVLALGNHPYGGHWPVGITGNATHTFALHDAALSVSGLTPAGRRHIVDPVSGEMRGGAERIAVEGRSALIAEILSTALYAAPAEKRAGIVGNFDGYTAYELYDGAETAVKIN